MTVDVRPTPSSPPVDTMFAVFREACAAVERGDVEGLLGMFHEVPGTFLYDYMPPRSGDIAHLRETFTASQTGLIGPMTCEIVEIATYLLSDDAAYTAAILHVAADYEGGERVELTYRSTDIWRRIDGRWAVVHEHASVPVDPMSGRGDLASAPG